MEEAQRDNADNGEQPNMEQAQHDTNADNGEQLQHVWREGFFMEAAAWTSVFPSHIL